MAAPLECTLSSVGKSPGVIARAADAEGTGLMQEATDDARRLGIFGGPAFAVATEIFWGDHRREDAVSFAARR